MTEIPTIRKFLFDKSFDKGVDPYAAERAAREAMKPIYTQEQVDQACEQAQREGFKAGQETTLEDHQAHYNRLIETLGQSLANLTGELQRRPLKLGADMADVAVTVAHKILPSYMEREGKQEVRDLIETTLRDVSREPRLVIRVPEDFKDEVEALVKSIIEKQALTCEISVLGGPQMGSSDCQIEWADGGIDRTVESFWSDIDATITRIQGSSVVAENSSPSTTDTLQ